MAAASAAGRPVFPTYPGGGPALCAMLRHVPDRAGGEDRLVFFFHYHMVLWPFPLCKKEMA